MKRARNGAVSALKLAAACFVVFIHIPFPGGFGQVMDCLARFAVPFFFAVSGYYAYRAEPARLAGRLKKIVILALAGNAAYLIWECVYRSAILHKGIRSYLAHLFTVENIASLVFMGADPFYGHLWYLTAMVIVYIGFILYTRFWKKPEEISYAPLYGAAFCGLMIHIAFGMKLAGAGLETDKLVYRNALYFGLPAFALGLFIRQYQERIAERYGFGVKKAVTLIALGLGLSLLQWFGIGRTSMPLGMLLVVACLLLLATSESGAGEQTGSKTALIRCAEISSTVVYLFHPLIHEIVTKAGKGNALLTAVKAHGMIYPLFIVAASLALGVCVWLASGIMTRHRKRG